MRLGFSKSHVDPNLYYKVMIDAPVIILLYVDDLFLTGVEPHIIQCKKELSIEFDMKDLGLMNYYLGLEVWHKRSEVFLGQGKYVVNILLCDDGLKIHGNSHCNRFEEVERL
jgi:hypothetical protein